MNAPELDKKVNISLYLIVAMVVASFTLGGTIAHVIDNDAQRDALKEFLLEEVHGHRADCDRRFKEVVEPRLEKLESRYE
jgi:hypothetical protein